MHILSYVGHVNVLTYRVYVSNNIINISSIIDSTICVYHFSTTPSPFLESVIHLRKRKLFIFYPRTKTIFHHNFIVYNISTFLFMYYVISNQISYCYLFVNNFVFLFFVHHVFQFLFPRLDTCISKLYMYNNHVVTSSFSYSTVIYMYDTEEVTLLYAGVMLNLIKHANILGLFLTILNNNDYSYKHLLSFQILYLQLYFNLLDTHIAQCYYHLFLILNWYNTFFVMLNYYINLTVCLLYNFSELLYAQGKMS